MRFHCLGLPHTVTSDEYVACAYTQKVLKFCKMMRDRGHFIIHYGHEESQVVCDEHVTVLTNKDLEKAYGNYDWRKNFFKFDTGDHAYLTFYENAIREVGTRKQKNDFILPFWGSGVKPICDAHQDMICVEPGIGYAGGHWARWKIWESYAIFHSYMGLQAVGECKSPWYDTVIPNYFDPTDFDFETEKDDYFLFLGRVYDGKGIHIAIQVTEKIGAKLIVAGQGDLKGCGYQEVPKHVEVLGYADKKTRRKLMSKAKGAFVASLYTEPFGGVQVECLLSGTPTITTDWGAFTENNLHGITGFRCRTFAHFCWAAKNIHTINPTVCRQWGMNYSMKHVGGMYEDFFKQVLNVYTCNGWYEPEPERHSLDFLTKATTPRLKIAVWSSAVWAVGRIHKALINSLGEFFDFTFFDWGVADDSSNLWNNWEKYDIIMGTTGITYHQKDIGFMTSIPEKLKPKLLAVVHHELLNHDQFTERIFYHDGSVKYAGITPAIVDIIQKETPHSNPPPLLPIGVNIEHFHKTREIREIQTVGQVGDGTSNMDIKRPHWLKEIADLTDTKALFLSGKPMEFHNKIYDWVDMLVVTSSVEGVATSICEAAACHIPVISTRVGYANQLKTIKTFDTPQEAVEIIKYFNSNPQKLEEYIKELADEVRTQWNWTTVAMKYWKPVLSQWGSTDPYHK